MAIRVLVVDDSLIMRKMIAQILSSDEQIEVIGTASNAMEARESIKTLNPDVVTLDIEMPGMDGISFLEKIMSLRPMPVVMISTLTQKGAEYTIQALAIGAVDCVGKPKGEESLETFKLELILKVKMAASAKVTRYSFNISPKEAKQSITNTSLDKKNKIIVIGASTGGVQALHELLTKLPADIPPIVIVQHIQGSFVDSFANRLADICNFPVVKAEHDTKLKAGTAYIADSGMHTEIYKAGGSYICRRRGSELVSNHLPSIDVLFHSVAKSAGSDAIGIILTGMGRDGAEGLLAMHNAGAYTIGQNAATSVVYGMPRVAYELGAVKIQLPLYEIASKILEIMYNNI